MEKGELTMADREKLIELQRSNCVPGKECHGDCMECMADHLIANGVTFATDDGGFVTTRK